MNLDELKKLQKESTYGFINALVEAFPAICVRIEELESVLKDSEDALFDAREEGFFQNSDFLYWEKEYKKKVDTWRARRDKVLTD